jgi:hypothetical protein
MDGMVAAHGGAEDAGGGEHERDGSAELMGGGYMRASLINGYSLAWRTPIMSRGGPSEGF